MTRGAKDPGGTAAGQARFAGQVGYEGGRPDAGAEPDLDLHDGARDGGDLDVRPSLADLDALAEPVFPSDWLTGPPASLADHPLLRGLLLELPPKGSVPPPGYLDRWFDAARSILELLYIQPAAAPRR